MARVFGGVSTDKLTTGLTAHSTLRTWAVWTYRTGGGGNGLGRIIEKGASATEFIYNSDGATSYQFQRNWSTGNGVWQIAQPSLNAWHHILVTYDGGATTNDPIIYIDGVSQTVTQSGADPSGTIVTDANPVLIGNNSNNNRVFAGNICEVAIWNRILTAAEASAIGAKGFSPAFFPNSLVEYAPLIRDLTSYKNSILTAVGTTVANHPRIIYPSNYNLAPFSDAAAPSVIPNKQYQFNQSIKRSNYY